MKAVPTVSSFPWTTYTKNDVTDTMIGAQIQISENMTEFRRAFTIHFISTSRASIARLIHCSSHAKNLMNFIAPMSSFSTPMRLSRALDTPLWIRTARLLTMLFNGQPTKRTAKPANAEKPRSWYRNVDAMTISKGAP